MGKNNLPIKIVLQKAEDIFPNHGGGESKFFGEVTPQVQREMSDKFESLLEFYGGVFEENENIPAVGKITVKPEAIAKTHKPDALCRNCPIIGTEDLNEIYIKVKRKSIQETIKLIKNPPSVKFRANMTAVSDIQPVKTDEKISLSLIAAAKDDFSAIKDKIKIRIFDFNDDFDNAQIWDYVYRKLKALGIYEKCEVISYGEHIKFLKAEVRSYEDVVNIASINGVKAVDFFQEYSLPKDDFSSTELQALLDREYADSEVTIGIIDGGISEDNPYLKPYIIAKEKYVDDAYRNPYHATFIASTIQYGNMLNGIGSPVCYRFKFVDIIAIPNSDEDFGPTDTISEYDLMDIIEEVMEKYSDSTKIWNLSLGIEDKPCSGSMSDLGIFLDYIQDKYHVQIFVSSGNINKLPLRNWPPQKGLGEHDRLISPADSVRAVTVGSVALFESDDSIVKVNEPSPFSRRGPGANYVVKPDIVDYGGNLSKTYTIDGLGVRGLGPKGEIIEGNGTSYSTPRALQTNKEPCRQNYAGKLPPQCLCRNCHWNDHIFDLNHSMHWRRIFEKCGETTGNVKWYGSGLDPDKPHRTTDTGVTAGRGHNSYGNQPSDRLY